MEKHILIFLIIGGLSFLALIFIIISKIMFSKSNRRNNDKKIIENHMLKAKPPTWRFQKFHPIRCPHHTGIYREIRIDSLKKTIFVCADCVDIIDVDEVLHRDKFKK